MKNRHDIEMTECADCGAFFALTALESRSNLSRDLTADEKHTAGACPHCGGPAFRKDLTAAEWKKAQADAVIFDAFSRCLLAQWVQYERDGRKDIGACGGYILALDGRSPVTKRLIERDLASRATGCCMVRLPVNERCKSQHGAITQRGGEAARDVFQSRGVRITEARPYTD